MLTEIHENAIYDVKQLTPMNKPNEKDYQNIIDNENTQGAVELVTDDFVILSDRRKYDLLDFMEAARFVSPALDNVTNFIPDATAIVDKTQVVINESASEKPVQPNVQNQQTPALQQTQAEFNPQSGIIKVQSQSSVVFGPAKNKLINSDEIKSLGDFTANLQNISVALTTLGYSKDQILEEIKKDTELSARIIQLYIESI